MQLTLKLLPPYRKPGEKGEYQLELEEERMNLRQLADYLARAWQERLAFNLIDDKGLLTAEFMVNGRPAALDLALSENDTVTVIPYICGG